MTILKVKMVPSDETYKRWRELLSKYDVPEQLCKALYLMAFNDGLCVAVEGVVGAVEQPKTVGRKKAAKRRQEFQRAVNEVRQKVKNDQETGD